MLILALPLPAAAQSMAKIDARALGMGGAHVAVAEGWPALHWNPAGLFVGGRRQVAISGGELPLEGGAWIDALRALRGEAGASMRRSVAAALLQRPGAGLAGERSIGAYLASTRWGIAYQQVWYVDEVATGAPGDPRRVSAAALRTREALLAMAGPLMAGRVAIGASLKLVQAGGGAGSLALEGFSGTLGASELLAAARGRVGGGDWVLATDVGILLMATHRWRLGLVAKNLNEPGLNLPVPSITRLPRQVRAGVMFRAHPSVRLAADLDLESSPFRTGGRRRRELAAGLEWKGAAVALRGGAVVDLEAAEREPLYTLGLGLGGDGWRADVAGSVAGRRAGFGWAASLTADW